MSRTALVAGGRRLLGGALPRGPWPFFLSALLVGAALLGATILARAGLRWWQASAAVSAPGVAVAETTAPSSPVALLDRIYLSTRLTNPGDRRLDDLAVELTVVGPDGQVAFRSRQRGVSLAPGDARAVYWAWRVPGAALAGDYRASVSISQADGTAIGLSSASGPPATFTVGGR